MDARDTITPVGHSTDERATWVPHHVHGADWSRFRLDPLSERVVGLVNGRSSVCQIAEDAGASLDDVLKRVDMLAKAGLLALPDPDGRASVVSVPPPRAARPTSPARSPEPSNEPPEPEPDPGADRSTLVPSIAPDADVTRFRLDLVSLQMLDLVDGRRSVAEIAGELDAGVDSALARLDAFRRAGLVEWTAVGESASMSAYAPAGEDRSGAVDRARPEIPEKRAPEEPAGYVGATTGDLSQKPAAEVLAEAAETAFSGCVRLERHGDEIEIHFKEGQPVGVISNADRHEHGKMLLKGKKIDAQMERSYREVVQGSAEHPVAALRESGLYDRRKLGEALTWRGNEIIDEVTGWTDGRYALVPGAPFPPKIARCRFKQPIKKKTDWRKLHLAPEEEDFLDKNKSKYLVATDHAGRVAAALRLKDKEASFFRHVISEPIQLAKAAAISSLFKSLTRNLLFRMIQQNAVELHETNPDGVRPYELEDLKPYSRRLEKANDFDVLGAHPISTEDEIRVRYDQRIAEFDPRLYPGAEPEHFGILETIRRRIDAAMEVLSTKERRQEYRKKVYGRDQLESFVDLQLRKAEVNLRMRGDAPGTLELVESVLDIDPANVTGRLLLAGALAKLGKRREASDQLRNIVAVPPQLRQELQDLKEELGWVK